LYFGDRGNDALKQGDWTPLPTDPSNIPTNGDNISPLFDNEIKLLKLKFGGSPLSGSRINEKTAAGQPTTVIISFKKKDVRRSPNNPFEMNTADFKGYKCTSVDSSNLSVPNHLSGAKIGKENEFTKNLRKKIAKWGDSPMDCDEFVLMISNLIGAYGTSGSKYKIWIDKQGDSYSLRLSMHNVKVINYEQHGNRAKHKYGVTFQSKDTPSTFEANPKIRAVEYVYFEEYTSSEQLKQIATAILNLLENGVWDESIAPADIKNVSPEQYGENLSGGLSRIPKPEEVRGPYYVYYALREFHGKDVTYHPKPFYGREKTFDVRSKWNQMFMLIDTTPTKYILHPLWDRGHRGTFFRGFHIAVDSETFENCFKQERRTFIPTLLQSEVQIALLKLKSGK